MSRIALQISMLEKVAHALGPIIHDVVFVGGCTTGLFLDDDFTLEQVRFTNDVDLIVDIATYLDFQRLTERLLPRGFKTTMDNEVICRLSLDELKVDFMPADINALGFTNRWFKHALDTAEYRQISPLTSIKLVTPQLFVATKLEAYQFRGNDDCLASHDIEDLLNLFDGRSTIVDELRNEHFDELKDYINLKLSSLLQDRNFEYAVQATARGDLRRTELIFNRIEQVLTR